MEFYDILEKDMNKGNEKRNEVSENEQERQSSVPNDLPDSPQDRERLQPEETIIELPDVKDIPGQEFVHVPPLGELADTTISSDDEEGVGLFDDDVQQDEAAALGEQRGFGDRRTGRNPDAPDENANITQGIP
jgi:hypothetical protein